MLPILRPFLTKPDPGPADLQNAIDLVQSKLSETNEKLVDLQDRRKAALVNGIDYSEIGQIDIAMRDASIDQERYIIATDELRKLLAEAELKAKIDQRDAIYDAAFQRRHQALHLFEQYDEVIRPVIAILEQIEQVEKQTSDDNARLRELDDQLDLPQENRHYVPGLEHDYWREAHLQYPPWSILDQTRLVDVGIARSFVWPRGWNR